jgi:hypothetical protein
MLAKRFNMVAKSPSVPTGYANYILDSSQGATAGRMGQSAITAVAVALLAAASRVWPWLLPTIYPTHAVPQMCHGTLPWGRLPAG